MDTNSVPAGTCFVSIGKWTGRMFRPEHCFCPFRIFSAGTRLDLFSQSPAFLRLHRSSQRRPLKYPGRLPTWRADGLRVVETNGERVPNDPDSGGARLHTSPDGFG